MGPAKSGGDRVHRQVGDVGFLTIRRRTGSGAGSLEAGVAVAPVDLQEKVVVGTDSVVELDGGGVVAEVG